MSSYSIKRYVMSGRGPKVTYSILDEKGTTLFKTKSGSFHAWCKKKDAQRVIDYLIEYGLDATLEKLKIDPSTLSLTN